SPVVAVLDTGCGEHAWLPSDIVTRHIELDGVPVGLTDDADPERYPDLYGQLDGEIDAVAGHGTFISGIVRQTAPDADILSIRVAGALGVVDESTLLETVAQVVELLRRHREDPKTGFPIDVLNLSLSYYHETPTDGLFSRTLYELLAKARELGCVVVCSAGNDAIDRPSFPASLWPWPGADNGLPADKGAPHVAVGALNPSSRSVALFSNVGPWVHVYAPGAAVVSTSPAFVGGAQAATRADVDGLVRETLDPDDYRGGFAVWSGTSFAAPYLAGRIAAELGAVPVAGATPAAAAKAVSALLAELPDPHDRG
uniref:S8 family peptidase n=1 Tax=Microbacterium sp. K35 TaxID=2305440 RepID=UPI001444048A